VKGDAKTNFWAKRSQYLLRDAKPE
jgi:hypothetical protein